MRRREEMSEQPTGYNKWVKRFGVAGFLFFFIKGILWLVVPTLLIWLGINWE